MPGASTARLSGLTRYALSSRLRPSTLISTFVPRRTSAARVEKRVAGAGLLGGAGIVEAVVGGHPHPSRSAAEVAAQTQREGRGRDVVEAGAVVEDLAREQMGRRLQRRAPRQSSLGLRLDAPDARLPAVPEEEEVGLRLVALDEVLDLVVVGVGAARKPSRRVTQGQVELQARLRIEVGVAGDEAAAGGSAEVAVGEVGVAEAARHLGGGREAAERSAEGGGGEPREGAVVGLAIAEVAALVAASSRGRLAGPPASESDRPTGASTLA